MIEGYFVWIDKDNKWHSTHAYSMNEFSLYEIYEYNKPIQVWIIPLPDNLPPIYKWFERQEAINKFRSKAITIAKNDFKEYSLKEVQKGEIND